MRYFQRQHGVIARRQALAAGLSRREIESRLARGEWVWRFKATFRLAGMPETQEQTFAAARLAAGDDALVSHRSAATLWGFPGVPRWVEVSVPRPRKVAVAGITVHRAILQLPDDAAAAKGIPVTSAARTLIDLAGIVSEERLGRLLDDALVNRLVRRAELVERAACLGRPGRRGAGVLASLLDARPEARPDAAESRPIGSEFEAKLFRALKAARLPLPEPQFRVVLPCGDDRFLDFAYPEVRLAIEADCYLWHASREAWERDRQRNNELVALGWSFLPLTWNLVRYQPAEAARQVHDSLRTRRAG